MVAEGSLPVRPGAPAPGQAVTRRRLADLFHALSDETRLRIVARLLSGERCVCDLAEVLDAAQSRLSFHLKALKDAGIVLDRREGRWIHYRLNPDALQEIVGFACDLSDGVRSRAVKCCF